MSTPSLAKVVTHPGIRRRNALRLATRVIGAGLLGAVAAIHLDLWLTGYRSIPTIGWMFLLNAVGVGLLALVMLAAPTGLLPWATAAGALAAAGTLAALVVSITVGLFGFQESLQAPMVVPTITVEAVGVVALGALAVLAWPDRWATHRRQVP